MLSGHTRSCGCLYHKSTKKAVASKNKDVYKQTAINIVLNPNPTAKNKTSSRKGVCFNKPEGRYMAYISVNGKRLYLGNYKTEAEAIVARKEAEEQYYGKIKVGD